MLDIFLLIVLVFFSLPIGYLIGKFTVANFSDGIISFFFCTVFAIVLIPAGFLTAFSAHSSGGFFASASPFAMTIVIVLMYLRKLGNIFYGFGAFMRPILKPFIFVLSAPYKIFKKNRDNKEVSKALKDLDDF